MKIIKKKHEIKFNKKKEIKECASNIELIHLLSKMNENFMSIQKLCPIDENENEKKMEKVNNENVFEETYYQFDAEKKKNEEFDNMKFKKHQGLLYINIKK